MGKRKDEIDEDDLDLDDDSGSRDDDAGDEDLEEGDVLEEVAGSLKDACDEVVSAEVEDDHVIVEFDDHSRWKITARKLT